MSDEKKYTERDVVLREREAYSRGMITGRRATLDRSLIPEDAAGVYPLPKVTRPRVVQDPEWLGAEWRVVDDHLEVRSVHAVEGAGWLRWSDFRGSSDAAPLPKRVAMWADLFANPTEECIP